MTEPTKSRPGLFGRVSRQRRGPHPITALNAINKREREASLAVLNERQKAERRVQFLLRLHGYWPIATGLMLGALSPLLAASAASFGHWCVVLVFPFVELASRPEIQVGGPFTSALPVVMLFAQFPLEGWPAWFILERRTQFSSVVMQVLLFHFLGIAELLLLSGRLTRVAGH